MIKKITTVSVVLMFMLFLFGSAVNVLATPPEDRAPDNQACENASETGIDNASENSENSILNDCEESTEASADPCSETIFALNNSDLCGG